jgi:hypothetical protein
MNPKETNREAERTQSNREELAERIARALPEDGTLDVFASFRLARSSRPTEPIHSLYQPAFCGVAQGRKQALLGDEVFRYDPGHYLIYTVDLPLTFQVEEASKERPYLGFRLNLDASLVASVMVESGIEPKKGHITLKAMDVSQWTPIYWTRLSDWSGCSKRRLKAEFSRRSSSGRSFSGFWWVGRVRGSATCWL